MMSAAQKVVSLEDHKEKVMGTPQTENGYVRIANELFDAILIRKFSGRQLKVLMAIIRKTYGYNKKSDEIGLSQISSMTGMARSHVSTTINELVLAKVIHVSEGHDARIISINKNYKNWTLQKDAEGVTKTVTVTESVSVTKTVTEGVTESVNEVLPKREPQYTGFKDSKTKTSKPLSGKPDDAAKIIAHLNEKTGSKFMPVKANLALIEARINEGSTPEDFIRVIDAKVSEWKDDPKMATYLRPKTLFNATNFSSYVGAANIPKEALKTLGGMKAGKNWV